MSALVLAACGAGQVIETGPSTFQVSAQEGLLTGGWPAAQQAAISKAKEYCSAKGQFFTLTGSANSGVPGWTPLTTVVSFTCGSNMKADFDAASTQCAADMQSSDVDAIRGKVEIVRQSWDAPVPFDIASNETFPTAAEQNAIARWAAIRDECIRRSTALQRVPPSATALQATFMQQEWAFERETAARVSELIVALYQGKLTYGEFAKNRYAIGKAGADAERQYRGSVAIADQQRQLEAQQLAQQQFQSNLAAWSTYMQAVNARQPQTVNVNVQGAVRLRTNCTSQQIGIFVSTNCY